MFIIPGSVNVPSFTRVGANNCVCMAATSVLHGMKE